MSSFVALLRAVNVGGTGKLSMLDLRALCEAANFRSVRTYIASGNVLFESGKSAQEVKQVLERQLHRHAGKPVGVAVRTAAELAQVVADNPFPDAPGDRVAAIFLDASPPPDLIDRVTGRAEDEEIRLGQREIYVLYGHGMGRSKLRIPGAESGTARNMNTIRKLAEMAAE
ncbi:MAG TPA: DUF1697 domain-containing protein [Methylovirgula sp.]|nr:DUF1697 domain-containing protein [Methylovirgula sp.]